MIRVIDPDNQAPVASAGSDQTINDTDRDDEAAVVLDGSGSSDSDGSIVSYSWTENGVEIAVGQKPSVILSTGKHLITLEVTDDDGISSTGEVLITIIDPYNVAPVAHAGSDALVVDENRDGVEKVSLDASASTDSDGTISAYVWTENDAEIASGKTAEVDLGLGVHQIVLTATDNDGASATAGVTIRVAQRPVADAGPDLTALDQDQDGSETVTLDASGSSAPFSTIVSYSWTENNAEIATGQSLNYTFAKGTHVLILTVANDYGLTASTELTVVVANPNNQAPVADAGDDVTLIDNANLKQVSYTLDGTASHDPDGAIISYVWTENNAVIATGETPSVDFAIGMHQVTLTVTDNEGASASDSFVITVKQGSCIIEPCTSDYIARVVSNDASNTTVTFEPTESGVGNSVCLFYYGTIENAQYPGHIVKPDEPFTLSGITMGQKVYFYYTYNMSNGLQQNTMNCKQSFTVGACSSETTELSDLYKQEISLYPSPVSDILQVSTTVDRIVISDLYGNPVMEDSHTARMNVSQLTPGLYIVYLVVNDQKTVRKIIKK